MSSMKRVVMVLLVLLVACAAPRTTSPEQQQEFRFGTEGIAMSFVPNLPPPRVFDKEPLNIVIQVENRGTSKIGLTNDRIYLSGFDNTIITGIGTDGQNIPELEPRTAYLPQGGLDTVSFKGTIARLAGKIDKYQPTILATACYGYETVASAQICIDPNPYAPTSQQKICTPSSIGLGSQGAPIAISSIDVEASPQRTRLKINIQNAGIGEVFKSSADAINKCSPYSSGLTFEDINLVQVSRVSISDIDISTSCKPLTDKKEVRLINGQATIFCEFTEPRGQAPYITPINVVLKYGYRQSITKQVEIRPMP